MWMMAKTTSINLRISPEFRRDVEALAAYHGLTMSSYVHSVLVKAIRAEKEREPHAFSKPKGIPLAPNSKHRIPAKLDSRRRKTG